MIKNWLKADALPLLAAIVTAGIVIALTIFLMLWFDVSSNIWARRVMFPITCVLTLFAVYCILYILRQVQIFLSSQIIPASDTKKKPAIPAGISQDSLPIRNKIMAAMLEARNKRANTPIAPFKYFLAEFCEAPLFITLFLLWEPYHKFKRLSTKNERNPSRAPHR